MTANVENMFSVKQTPWHGIGTVLDDAPTTEEGIKLAGLDWDVLPRSIFYKEERKVSNDEGGVDLVKEEVGLDDFGQVFIRSDNRLVLGMVGPRTTPLQNSEAFKFFDPFLEQKLASLETAGSLDEGRKVWVMAKLNSPNSEITKDDEVAKFVLLSNSHDGTTAVRVGFTPIRVVCANTLAAAHSSKQSELIRVRHNPKVLQNVEKIRDIVNLANEGFEATAEKYRFLASRGINQKDLEKYVRKVFKVDEPEEGEKIHTRTANTIASIVKRHEDILMVGTGQLQDRKALYDMIAERIEAGRGNEAANASWWTAYNAVNEYLNYEKGRTEDSRMNSLWFGENGRLNERAFKIAMEFADLQSA